MDDTLESISEAASDRLEGGDPYGALPLYVEAVAMATSAGRLEALSGLYGDLAVAYRRTGDVDAAIRTNFRAIEAASAVGNNLNLAQWSGNLGGLLYQRGDLDGAETCFRNAMTAAVQTGDGEQLSIAAGNLASAMGARGRYSEALALLTQARDDAPNATAIEAIVRRQEIDLLLNWAQALRQENRFSEAREVIQRATAALADAAPTKATVLLLILLGDIEENEGNIVAAAGAIAQAAHASEAIGESDEAKDLRELERRMRG